MNANTTLEILRKFVAEREWSQFHSPSNLAKSISIESGELLELFQWDENFEIESLSDELADVMIYCYLLADKLDLDTDQIIRAKVEKNRKKYSIEKSRGNSVKYDKF